MNVDVLQRKIMSMLYELLDNFPEDSDVMFLGITESELAQIQIPDYIEKQEQYTFFKILKNNFPWQYLVLIHYSTKVFYNEHDKIEKIKFISDESEFTEDLCISICIVSDNRSISCVRVIDPNTEDFDELEPNKDWLNFSFLNNELIIEDEFVNNNDIKSDIVGKKGIKIKSKKKKNDFKNVVSEAYKIINKKDE